MTSSRRYWFDLVYKLLSTSRLGRLMSIMLTSALQVIQPSFRGGPHHGRQHVAKPSRQFDQKMMAFAAEVQAALESPLQAERLLAMSAQLEAEYRDRLQDSNICMLPSYQHTLPTGDEKGDFLALDVGGSTFRIALIRLSGRHNASDAMRAQKVRSWVIDNEIRALPGREFFDWMAIHIEEMLEEYYQINARTTAPLQIGLAWSFPIDQTSPRTGKLLPMGKGFLATVGVEGRDLSELIMESCSKRGLNVEMRAIVNDGAATLLSQAYQEPSTRLSLILGTGTNAAIFLPVSSIGSSKFGSRPESWYNVAKRVIVNTEMSMFGKGVLPTTKWDDELNARHILPNFQPLEYLITGRYLGEIVRLILVDAILNAGLFDGHMPDRLDEPYTLDTRLTAGFEMDTTAVLSNASRSFFKAHPLPAMAPQPSLAELEFIRDVTMMVSERAAIYLSTAIHALWSLRVSEEKLEAHDAASRVTVACCGTIIEKYPAFRARCQQQLDAMCTLSGATTGAITLEMAPESSLFGAAVAVSCIGDE